MGLDSTRLDFSLDEGQLELRAGARQSADGVLTGVAAALEFRGVRVLPGPVSSATGSARR